MTVCKFLKFFKDHHIYNSAHLNQTHIKTELINWSNQAVNSTRLILPKQACKRKQPSLHIQHEKKFVPILKLLIWDYISTRNRQKQISVTSQGLHLNTMLPLATEFLHRLKMTDWVEKSSDIKYSGTLGRRIFGSFGLLLLSSRFQK